jgi:SAM-dependent methyltransferase
MATPTPKTQYNTFAPLYTSITDLPCSKLEAELIHTALLSANYGAGPHVLDLGGGSGLHARRALDAGAATVDVVDVSREMMRVGADIEASLAREGRIRWFEADLSRPVAEQLPQGEDGGLRPGGYDIVMANWLFDHATSVEELRGMWANVVGLMKPGGWFLGVRVQSVWAEYMREGKYGATFAEIGEIPGGVKYVCGCRTQPPFEFGCTSMESTYSLADDIPKEMGLVDFQVVPPAETEVVKGDLEYWEDFLKEPNLAVVTARKPALDAK